MGCERFNPGDDSEEFLVDEGAEIYWEEGDGIVEEGGVEEVGGEFEARPYFDKPGHRDRNPRHDPYRALVNGGAPYCREIGHLARRTMFRGPQSGKKKK